MVYEMIINDNIRDYRGTSRNAQPDPVSERERFEDWLMNLSEREYEDYLLQKRVRA